MSEHRLLWLVSCLLILASVGSACGVGGGAPSADEAAARPTTVQQENDEQGQGHESEQAINDLKPLGLGAGERLEAVATTNIVADIVSQVGGDAIVLTPLLPIGADPHTYVPKPQDLTALARVDVVFANGADLEAPFLPQLLRNTDAPVVYLSQGLDFRAPGEGEEHGHEDEAEAEGEHSHSEGVDPHTWTSPANALVFVHNVERALSALDPANAETFRANAEAYEARLQALDEWVRTQVETIPSEKRELVTDHAIFGYYADRYGLEQIGAIIPGFITGAEPSARELAQLEDAIRKYDVRAIFVGTTVNPSLAEQVAEDTGTQVVTLYTGSLGPEGSEVDSYIEYICYNTLAIVGALGGTPDAGDSPCDIIQ
jgi:ABC-type Zn uptake system ZnuABC Zn-binding protein ZnuA